MKFKIFTGIAISISLFSTMTLAAGFGQSLCKSPNYHCVKVTKGQSWNSLFPDPDTRMVVKKVNRMNTPLHNGMVIAVPNNLTSNVMDFSPFPTKIDSAPASGMVQVSLSKLAWGAYDSSGTLLNWGPVSGGKGYCPDIHHGCHTPTGSFKVFDKQGAGCISHVFPIATHGGAPMPYCMHFHGGFALHGSPTVPGFNASHGCVRMFTEDAMWLNHNFVELGETLVKILP
ncbi:MAG: L,D-transpeptidase [Proteobacteria bacterium]|nr:L,D-transpeptidase [Pseudomonadota bacterium]